MSSSNLIGFVDGPMRGINQTVTFDPNAFDHAISTHGVRLVHWSAMRCPQGMVDRYDNRMPDHNHSGCSNGFVFTRQGAIMGLFTGNGSGQRLTDVGYVDGSTVQVTLHRRYEPEESGSCPDVFVTNFDRFYLDEDALLVPTWQLVESHITGKDKLQFPVVQVQDVMDSDGKRYLEGVDFEVEKGLIVWGRNRPKFNIDADKGSIYVIRYLYRPYFYVKQMGHQIRMAQLQTGEGVREVVRMPQSMVLQREYMWETEVAPADSSTKVSGVAGIVPMPSDGSFGPR